MDQKMLINLYAAAVPVVIGAIWYNPYLLGRLWGGDVGLSKQKLSAGMLTVTVVLTYIGGYYIARTLGGIVIHQHGLHSMLAGEPDLQNKSSELYKTVEGLMDKYGHNYRTFKHGAFHGVFTGAYLVLPVLLTIGLMERKKVTWILIHAAFWALCLSVMGGIVCAYMP